jgi:hypothetical protein
LRISGLEGIEGFFTSLHHFITKKVQKPKSFIGFEILNFLYLKKSTTAKVLLRF